MALIQCYECGQNISDKSISCPACGEPSSISKEVEQNSPVTFAYADASEGIQPPSSKAPDTPNVPIALYRLTAIVGVPLGTIIAIIFNSNQKKLIADGKYNEANSSIVIGKIVCTIISVPCILVIIAFSIVLYMGYGIFGVLSIIILLYICYFLVSKLLK